ncbi:MAG: YidC/Oxa1 family membrane protein insertase [Lachnospiraceae bacterium]|nr:YidC/Oxa1 family membrane protein insertase [Lachnospiraceae bacterium]
MLTTILLTQSTVPVIGWVAWILGKIMAVLFTFCDSLFGSANIGVCIILFTVIVNLLMLPLTIKQQKSSKLMTVMQPEIQAIQKKYKGKNDQQSAARMQAETQAVYEKYGTSMTGGCVQLLIQMPILFALYQVIYHIPGYVPQVKELLTPLATALQKISNFISYAGFTDLATAAKMAKNLDYGNIDNVIDLLYKLTPAQWETLQGIFPSLSELIGNTAKTLESLNSFLGINLATAPWQGLKPNWAWLIPVLAGLTQWASTKFMTQNPATPDDDSNPAASSMKTMNVMMPIMSVFFCFTLPAGIGVYWIASAVVRTIIQIFINMKYKNIDVDKLVAENLEKTNKKRAKKGLPPKTIDKKAIAEAEREERIREYQEAQEAAKKEKSDKQVIDSTKYYNFQAKEGSLAAKANMVAMYDQREYEKRHGKKSKKTSAPESADADNKEKE